MGPLLLHYICKETVKSHGGETGRCRQTRAAGTGGGQAAAKDETRWGLDMKILCYGSLNVDHVYGVDHFVRGGETIPSLSRELFCGGKGLNQSVALARAGGEVYHAGKVGADGGMLLDRLRQNGVNADHVSVSTDLPTGHAVIQVDAKGQNCIIVCAGANGSITEQEMDEVLSHFGQGDILLLQNEINGIGTLMRKAYGRGMQIALNPSPIDRQLASLEELRYVTWFILNEVEGCELTGQREGAEICSALLQKYPRARVVLTLGKKGCLYRDGEKTAAHGIYDVPVVDTTAAGDTFTGYFLAGVTDGLPVERILELASKASSLAVSRRGAADSIPARAEVEACTLALLG